MPKRLIPPTPGWLVVAVMLALSPVSRAATLPWVARAQFTSAVRQHEPVDDITTLAGGAHQVYYFVDLRQMTGQAVTLVWRYRGAVVSTRTFHVRGPRWRVFTRVVPESAQQGEWNAEVVNGAGVTLAVNTLIVLGPSAGAATQVHQQK